MSAENKSKDKNLEAKKDDHKFYFRISSDIDLEGKGGDDWNQINELLTAAKTKIEKMRLKERVKVDWPEKPNGPV